MIVDDGDIAKFWSLFYPTALSQLLSPKIIPSALLNYIKFADQQNYEAMELWKGRSGSSPGKEKQQEPLLE